MHAVIVAGLRPTPSRTAFALLPAFLLTHFLKRNMRSVDQEGKALLKCIPHK